MGSSGSREIPGVENDLNDDKLLLKLKGSVLGLDRARSVILKCSILHVGRPAD